MMETQPALVPHMGSQDICDFCDNAESLRRPKTVQLPAELDSLPLEQAEGIGGMVDGGAIGSAMENAKQPSKKRKRCGVCIPCLKKEPCGTCYHCVNRSTSHQICKMRKCVELKKKRAVPLKGLEVVNKNDSKILSNEQVQSLKSCSESTSVDGPETDQMETGPVTHIQEGRLNLECDPGLLNKGCKDLGNSLLMETHSWLSNIPISQNSGEKINWENSPVPTRAATNNSSSLEDAKNLVAFSAVAEAMSYGTSASGTPSLSVQLYEKFNYEMNRESSSLSTNKPPDCPEDLTTLKAALNLAKHGVKPPNCNCDGPECPDYLEWLENKIKGHPDSSQNLLSQVGREIDNSYPKNQVLALENKTAKCTSGPLPFSQNALSIAKEKNISLQTAIAIEALTQLSSALPQPNIESPSSSSQTSVANHGHLTYFPSGRNDQGHGLPISCNELLQNQQYTDKNALPMSQPLRHTPWEQSKKASFQEGQYIPENHLSHSSPVLQNQNATPKKSQFMQQWVQTSEQLKTPSDPMTGLKQLLGNADDYIKPVFKGPESLPTKIKKSRQSSVKKEAAGEIYKMSPNQQQLSQLFQEADFHRTAQAALQQHLHHKRNLFLDPNSVQEGSQEQPNWWVPNSQPVPKTIDKPIKERKKRGRSPSNKKAELKIKTPRKQIQIKKPRQKDGQPVFMPIAQINIEECHRAPSVEPHPKQNDDQSIPNLDNQYNLNTQEMCTVNQGDGQGNRLSYANSQTNSFGQKGSCSRSSVDDTSSSSGQGESIDQQGNTGHNSAQNELIDDKFEDLIRQFEAEFGEDFPLPGAEIPSQNGQGPPKSATELQSKLPFPSQMLPADNTTRSLTHSDPPSNTSLPQEMPNNFDNLFSSKSPKKIKIESSGAITVVSTTCFYSEENQQLDGTPTKSDLPFNPTLAGFLESPMNYLTSPTKSLLDTPAKRAQAEFPTCTCVEQINEKDEGPYYTHLGSGPTVPSIRELMEERYGEKGKAIRIEKVIYTGKEGKSSRGCPIAKWVIRRQSDEEKLLVLVRHRAGHSCENAVIIILIMAWEGISRSMGDSLYNTITETITKYGNPTSRRCGLNDDRTCACQGKDPNTCGASFSFGCSWSMYFNGCKYARSKTPRKFRLIGDNPKEEDVLKDNFQDLATKVAPLYKRLAPQAYTNQVNNEEVAIDCRLGLEEGRPFSGVTACMDFCAHAHKDQHNLYNGCTVVCTLTKEDNRTVGKIAEDEQLHVLPLYKVCETDEFGSEEGQADKIRKGGIQVLTSFPREVRKLPEPAKSCRQRQLEAKKAAAEKKKLQKEKLTTPDKPKQEPEDIKINQQNPSMTQQPVKPCIKIEPSNHYNTFKYNANGVVESYSVLGSCRPSDPYSMNSVYSYHSFYAQPPTLPSLNGYHSKFALPSFGYYGFSGNPVVPSQYMNYGSADAKSGGWMNSKKSEMQSGSENISQGYGNEQNYGKSGDRLTSTPLRTTPAPVETTPYFNKVIKKEPVNDYSYDPFQRSPSVHSQSPALNLSVQKSNQAIPFKANGAMSSERTNSEGSQSMYMTSEKANLANGLDKRDYYGAHANGVGFKSYHGQNKQWGAYGLDAQASQCDSDTSRKVWSSCKLSDSSSNLISFENAQDKNWNGGRAMKETTAFQGKLWNSVAGNDRCSVTPSGMQDKSWNMFAAPTTPSTPLKSAGWDPYSLDDNMEETPVKKEENDEEEWSDSEHNFLDDNIGGVAVAPGHGSILIECARRELHATTPLKKPNRCHPTRISLVFYQHKNLNQPNHGLALWEAKVKQLAERARLREEEAARLGIKQEAKSFGGKKRKLGGAATTETPPIDKKDFIPTRQAATNLTNSFTTSSSYAYTKVTGPYNRWI